MTANQRTKTLTVKNIINVIKVQNSEEFMRQCYCDINKLTV